MTKDQRVRLILDTSAVLAYARGSINVGETITEVIQEGGWIGASVVCLAEASRVVPQQDAFGVPLLANHDRFVALPAEEGEWRKLAWWAKTLDGVDRAATAIEALDRRGYVVTAEPEVYEEKVDGELPVIAI